MDIDGDDDSAFSDNSDFQEGSSYSMPVFFPLSRTQLDPMQAKASHLLGRKKAIMRTRNYRAPSFG